MLVWGVVGLSIDFVYGLRGETCLRIVAIRYKPAVSTFLELELQRNPIISDTLGTAQSVLIKGGVLISGVVLYTSLCSWDRAWCPD
jgi:hypothetical protein